MKAERSTAHALPFSNSIRTPHMGGSQKAIPDLNLGGLN